MPKEPSMQHMLIDPGQFLVDLIGSLAKDYGYVEGDIEDIVRATVESVYFATVPDDRPKSIETFIADLDHYMEEIQK